MEKKVIGQAREAEYTAPEYMSAFFSNPEPETPAKKTTKARSKKRTKTSRVRKPVAPEYKINPEYLENVNLEQLEKKNLRVQLVLQPSLYEKAKAVCKARGCKSFNSYIQQLIEEDIKKESDNG